MNRVLLFLCGFLLSAVPAYAGTGTITVLDSTSTTRTYDVITDGSGNFVSKMGLCDYSAAANCAGVDSGHSLQVAGEGTAGTPAGGVVSMQGVSSGTAIPISGASGSLASGAGTDGWDATEGTKADSAWSSGSGSVIAILKTVATNTGSIIPGCQIKATTTCNVIGSVYSAAHTYNTVAASQTTQALTGGSGGATGDYLSHCTLMPTSTSPGELIIYDNSTAIYTVTLGSTSVSNLVPFTIPIGAISTSGAWKVTTGANETVTCVGAFT